MSTLRVTNVQDTAGANSLTTAQIYNGAAKAWVNFNGTGTVAIRASFNVSSITDNGTGDYTVNFTTALADASYAYSHAYSNEVNVRHTIGFLAAQVASEIRVNHYDADNSVRTADKATVNIAVFR